MSTDQDCGAVAEMPKYKCHKTVHALKIKDIIIATTGMALIKPEDDRYAAFNVDVAYMNKHKPQIGGYYVVYEGGYKSFSPAKAFEGGYTLED